MAEHFKELTTQGKWKFDVACFIKATYLIKIKTSGTSKYSIIEGCKELWFLTGHHTAMFWLAQLEGSILNSWCAKFQRVWSIWSHSNNRFKPQLLDTFLEDSAEYIPSGWLCKFLIIRDTGESLLWVKVQTLLRAWNSAFFRLRSGSNSCIPNWKSTGRQQISRTEFDCRPGKSQTFALKTLWT